MARAYECGKCEHVQVVGVIDNGRSGFANPHAVCDECGAKGQFHFAPGVAADTRKMMAGIARAAKRMERKARPKEQSNE